jgi:hypothetical protein
LAASVSRIVKIFFCSLRNLFDYKSSYYIEVSSKQLESPFRIFVGAKQFSIED